MLDVRTALILLGSAGVGVLAVALRLADGGSWPAALLVGGGAAAGACALLGMLIRPGNPRGEEST
jgi:hypothetical protein